MNTEAERKAIEIRVRAERRAGELLAAMQRKPIGRPENNSASVAEFNQAIESTGIPERTARRWQELAEVPAERFEAHLSAEEKPSRHRATDRE